MSIIGDACLWALKQHIINQWRWPRESDLVVDLVVKIRSSPSLGSGFVQNNPMEDIPSSRKRQTQNNLSITPLGFPLVRTEVKLDNSELKIDICLLQGRPTVYYGSDYGRRNIVLSIKSVDVKEILEVKLDPHVQGNWIGDLVKLYEIWSSSKLKCPLHLLAIDNSLELQAPRIKDTRRKKVFDWPMQNGKDIRIAGYRPKYPRGYPKNQPRHEYAMTLRHISPPVTVSRQPGIYIWALGEASGSTISNFNAAASCWKLDLSTFVKTEQKLSAKFGIVER